MRSIALCAALLTFSLATSPAHAKDKLWGVGIHLGQSKSDYETVERALRELGVNSFRDDLLWGHLEKKDQPITLPPNLRELQKLLVHGGENGLKGIIVLAYGNKKYFPGMPKTDADREAFAAYATWVARTYGRLVGGFEVWNEWNMGSGSNTKPQTPGTPEDYVPLLARVHGVLRKEAPGVPVIAGATSRDKKWIARFGELGGFKYCDGFSVHPYNHHDRDTSAEEVVRWLDGIQASMKAQAKKPVPIYVTEIGWPNHDGVGGSPEVLNAQRLLKLNLLLASRSYIAGTWWYDLIDDGDRRTEMEDNFGLMRLDGTKKPAFSTFATFMRHFGKAKFVKNLSTPDATILEFTSPAGKRVVAAWVNEGTRDKQLKVSGTWQLVPYELSDSERIERELKESGAAPLGVWPVVLTLSKGAKVQVTSTSPLSGCIP